MRLLRFFIIYTLIPILSLVVGFFLDYFVAQGYDASGYFPVITFISLGASVFFNFIYALISGLSKNNTKEEKVTKLVFAWGSIFITPTILSVIIGVLGVFLGLVTI